MHHNRQRQLYQTNPSDATSGTHKLRQHIDCLYAGRAHIRTRPLYDNTACDIARPQTHRECQHIANNSEHACVVEPCGEALATTSAMSDQPQDRKPAFTQRPRWAPLARCGAIRRRINSSMSDNPKTPFRARTPPSNSWLFVCIGRGPINVSDDGSTVTPVMEQAQLRF